MGEKPRWLGMVMTFKYKRQSGKEIINVFDFTKIKRFTLWKTTTKNEKSNYILGEIQKTHWTKDFSPKYKRNSKNSRIRKQMKQLKKIAKDSNRHQRI